MIIFIKYNECIKNVIYIEEDLINTNKYFFIMYNLKKVYFHVYKSSVTKFKCIFNRSRYELRQPVSNESRIDWKIPPSQ